MIDSKISQRLLVFSHVPKTAGLTMTYLLRRHFGSAHLDAMYRRGTTAYRPRDFAIDRTLYPKVRSIAGHSLKPFVDFGDMEHRMWWYTIVREPISRFISHYQHEVEKGGKSLDFITWMKVFRRSNWQVRMLANEENLEAAKQIVLRKLRFIGLQEQFNASLLMLRERAGITTLNVRYHEMRNTSSGEVRQLIENDFKRYRNDVIRHNELDLQLYEWIVKDVWPRQVEDYGSERLRKELLTQFGECKDGLWTRAKLAGQRARRISVYRPIVALDSWVSNSLQKRS